MARIQLLQDDVINKIAAGEVVERPASIVKELVENAIDAGASEITIELAEGGSSRITVSDNGSGMDKKDLELSLQRHATSKIRNADDLFSIATMGFRGEALPSIASVSKLTIASCESSETEGWRIRVEGGEKTPIDPWLGAKGTSVTVEELFYNLPVRRRFLKSAQTEYSYCLELVQAIVLSQPQVGITLIHNGREQLRAPRQKESPDGYLGESTLRQRAEAVFGDEVAKKLVYLKEAHKFGHVEGLISPPGLERSNGKQMLSFVNRRWVKDKLVRLGVMRGYHSHLLKSRYPITALFLQIEPSLVDVNVHPAKTELRFQYGNDVQGAIAIAIRNVLRQGAWAGLHRPPLDFGTSPGHTPISRITPLRESRLQTGSGYESRSWSPGRDAPTASSVKNSGFSAPEYSQRDSSELNPIRPESNQTGGTTANRPLEQQRPIIDWSELTYLGSFAACYLLLVDAERLLVVDQHALHERILYEKLKQKPDILGAPQPLLMPECVSLAPELVALLIEHQSELSSFGLRYKALDTPSEIELLAVPVLLQKRDPAELLSALATSVSGASQDGVEIEEIQDHLLATMACHSAVRAGEVLSNDDLEQLLQDAYGIDFYHNCPHGRRVFRWFSRRDVSSWFDRV